MKQEEESRILGFIRVHDFDTEQPVYVREDRIIEFFEHRLIVRGQREDFTLEVLESCAEIAELIRADNPFDAVLPIIPNPYPDPFRPSVTWAVGTGNASRENNYDDGR